MDLVLEISDLSRKIGYGKAQHEMVQLIADAACQGFDQKTLLWLLDGLKERGLSDKKRAAIARAEGRA